MSTESISATQPTADPATAVQDRAPGQDTMAGAVPTVQATPAAPAKPARREHRFDIDLLRVLCACAIILGHVGGECMNAVERTAANGPAVYWTGLFLDSVTSWAVPMYFAIAGWAVLVGAPPRDGSVLRTRALRMIIPVAVWTVVYLAWGRLRHTNGGPTSELALEALLGTIQPAYHLWYFYAHIPLVLVLGFAVLAQAGKRPWGVAVALLAAAAGPTALSDIATLTGWDVPRFGWHFGLSQIVYAVVGTMLLTLPPTKNRRWWLAGAAAALTAVLWSQDRIHFVIPNASIFVALLSAAVLLSVNGLRIPERWRLALTRLTGAGLGAFMVHILFLKTLAPYFVSADRGWLAAAAAATALFVATTVPAFGLSLLWGRLGLSRYLG